MPTMEQEAKETAKHLAQQNKARWQLFFLYGKLSLNEIMLMDKSHIREFLEAHDMYGEKFKQRVEIDYNPLVTILNKMFAKR